MVATQSVKEGLRCARSYSTTASQSKACCPWSVAMPASSCCSSRVMRVKRSPCGNLPRCITLGLRGILLGGVLLTSDLSRLPARILPPHGQALPAGDARPRAGRGDPMILPSRAAALALAFCLLSSFEPAWA